MNQLMTEQRQESSSTLPPLSDLKNRSECSSRVLQWIKNK